MGFTVIDVLAAVLGIAGLGIATYRAVSRRPSSSTALTLLAACLGAAVLLRSPWLGDRILDEAAHSLTGWWNLPDLIGHLVAFGAIAAGVTYLAQALLPQSQASRTVIGVIVLALAAFAAACVGAYVAGGGYEIQATNMVAMDGMAGYSLVWAACLLFWHAVTAFVAAKLIAAFGWFTLAGALAAAAFAGSLMALHRVIVALVPDLYELHYSATTWTLTALTIAGYLVVAALVTRQRSTAGGRVPAPQ